MDKRKHWYLAVLSGVILMLFITLGAIAADSEEIISSIADLKGRKVAIQTGTTHDQMLEDNADLEGDVEYLYFNAVTDMIQALLTGKVDAVPMDKPVALIYKNENPSLKILEEVLNIEYYGIGFQKNSPYVAEFNSALKSMKENGVLEELEAKWTGTDDSKKTVMAQDWDAPNGVLQYWLDTTYEPIVYLGAENTVLGYEVDLVLHAAQIMGYHIEFTPCNFDGLIPALVSQKADLVSSGMGITEERAQTIDFSDPVYESSVTILVRGADSSAVGDRDLFKSISDSFYKTFIKDNRWRLFIEGIGITLLITILSAVFGTILGFLIYLLCRSSRKMVERCFEFFFSVLERMPIIVFLMVLYYVILGSFDVSGIVVSIIAFTCTFSVAMYGMLKTGVNAVNVGQTEAGYALGYNKRDTFFKIVLPQAARIFIPSYKSELIALIKGTAIVGYIAVQDLTKMSDIVRSRTYEAFFPLITTAIIYVLITLLLTLAINVIEIRIDPKRRKKKSILKGVKTDD